MKPLPDAFVQTNLETFGEDGAHWLQQLPTLLNESVQRWTLTLHAPFPNLSYNYVAPATLPDGAAVVFKAGVPRDELSREIEAIRFYNGRGMARLIDGDTARGIMLLELVKPGTPLTQLEDDARATEIAAEVMRQLWRPLPPDHPFRPVEEWARGLGRLRERFDGSTGPLPRRLVEVAASLFDDLFASAGEPVLLHGDLHHDNILSAERSPWLAIDPKGMVGEAAYEIGPLLYNPPGVHTWPNLRQIQARRVDQLADLLGFDRQRIVGWGVAQAVLSAWWTIEDNGHDWEPAIICAESLAQL